MRFLWQPGNLSRIWVLPAKRPDWSELSPLQRPVLVFSQTCMSCKEVPAIRRTPIDHCGDHGSNQDPPHDLQPTPPSLPPVPEDDDDDTQEQDAPNKKHKSKS